MAQTFEITGKRCGTDYSRSKHHGLLTQLITHFHCPEEGTQNITWFSQQRQNVQRRQKLLDRKSVV